MALNSENWGSKLISKVISLSVAIISPIQWTAALGY
jgi:hypothetical protein